MARDYKILGPAECPRCGAKSKLLVEDSNSTSDALAISIACPKCRKRGIVGVTSRQQMNRIERHAKLLKKYKEAKTPAQRGLIMNEIKKMSSDEEEFMEGISYS